MFIRIKPLPLGIKLLHAMLLQRIHQNGIRHFQPTVQVHEILVFRGEFFFGNRFQGAVQVVEGFEEIFGEFLEGKVPGGGDFAFGLFLEVAVFRDLTF